MRLSNGDGSDVTAVRIMLERVIRGGYFEGSLSREAHAGMSGLVDEVKGRLSRQ